MDKLKQRVSIQTEGANNVLVLELQENDRLIGYCCKILEHNKIPGLLPVRRQNLDGTMRLRYNINGKVPLGEFMRNHSLTYKNGVHLLRNLTQALQELDEYFLTIDMCYLDPEQIYVGDGLCVYIPCVPVEAEADGDSNQRLKRFYEELLIRYFATSDCDLYDNMFKWVYKSARMDLQLFTEKFLQEEPEKKASAQADSQMEKSSPVRKPEPKPILEKPAVEKTMDSLQKKAENVIEKIAQAPKKESVQEKPEPVGVPNDMPDVMNIPGGGSFAIPGQDSAPDNKADKKKHREKPGLFSFLKKNKEADEPSAEPEVPPIPQPPIPQPPVPQPPMPIPSRMEPRPARRRASTSEDDSWAEGTIYVDNIQPKAPAKREQTPQAAQPYLEHNGQKIPVQTTPFLIGKFNTQVQLHYAIYDNNKVSRNHATLLQKDGNYYIRDNQSRNGTLLNGQLLLPMQMNQLHDGDEIKLYDEKMIFHLGAAK